MSLLRGPVLSPVAEGDRALEQRGQESSAKLEDKPPSLETIGEANSTRKPVSSAVCKKSCFFSYFVSELSL